MKLAAGPGDIFGQISSPYAKGYQALSPGGGLIFFLNNILRLLFVIGGIWFFLNLVIAGFQFLNAGGDPKGIEAAWNKIWQSLVGLLIIVTSFVIAALVGQLFFGNPGAIFIPEIYGPD